MRAPVLLLCLIALACAQTPAQRATALMQQMTLAEKIQMVHGWGGSYVGDVPTNSRLKIPALTLEDGPQGVADGVNQVTCWPSSLCIAASWDTSLMYQWASALGQEQRGKGTNIMLGPDVNIGRVPLGGRIFEMFGEDPYLTSVLAVPSVQGIQSQGVLACAKHFIDNDQEYQRGSISVEVDQRVNWEIYYQPFQAAVDAGVGSIMCSYNRINGTYACENAQTLRDLKQVMGYQNFVMSDWGATHSTVAAANNGLDQQMPDDSFFGKALEQAVNNSQVSMTQLNDMVVRILTPLYAVGIMNTTQTGNINANVMSTAHNNLARDLATAGTALLQNTGNILPLNYLKVKSIAVIGDDGHDSPLTAGGGSGHVNAPYVISPLQGIKNIGENNFTLSYANSSNTAQAASLAKLADVAIVFVTAYSSEGSDRSSLSLEGNGDALIESVAAAQPNTIVVIHAPGAVLMPWVKSVKGILFAFFPGQETGNAIADVLFGFHNPSAKLPITFPVNENDWFDGDAKTYPGVNGQIWYNEQLLVGHRWYDAKQIEPLFPFGHGLSYTTFTYSNLAISGSISSGAVAVTFDIKNSGSVLGSEVAQLYLAFPQSAGEPPKILRGFQKVSLTPGQTQTVTLKLAARDVSIYDESSSGWAKVSGTFGVAIGSSSRDIRLNGSFNN